MNTSTLRPAKPMQSRTFAATVEYRPYGEDWGSTRYTVTLTATAQGIKAEVDGEAAPLSRAVGILESAARVEVLAEVPFTPPSIGKARAAKLHRLMGRLGLPSAAHYDVAALVLGEPVSSLAALSEEQARQVWAGLCARFPQARTLAA